MAVPLDDNYVCITALIDNSGSMASLDTSSLAASLTQMIRDQCDNEVIFYGATFNDKFNIFADGLELNNSSNYTITTEHIQPDGMTVLYPAFARMIKYTGKKLSDMTTRRPGKVIFILLSDGEQTQKSFNESSRSPEDVDYEGNNAQANLKKLIEEHTNVYSWQFLYLGTNYDSIKAGKTIGIAPTNCINYMATPQGSTQVTRVCSSAMSRFRNNNFNGFEEEERSRALDG
jgi:hypothetical protein